MGGGRIPCTFPAPAIAIRRLTRTNTLLLEIITGLYDEQASRRSAPTAPSAKWHLWHVARWSDILQSTLFPVANGESDLSNKGAELWDALGVGNEQSAKINLPKMVRIVGDPRSSFELCEMRFSQIDDGLVERRPWARIRPCM